MISRHYLYYMIFAVKVPEKCCSLNLIHCLLNMIWLCLKDFTTNTNWLYSSNIAFITRLSRSKQPLRIIRCIVFQVCFARNFTISHTVNSGEREKHSMTNLGETDGYNEECTKVTNSTHLCHYISFAPAVGLILSCWFRLTFSLDDKMLCNKNMYLAALTFLEPFIIWWSVTCYIIWVMLDTDVIRDTLITMPLNPWHTT